MSDQEARDADALDGDGNDAYAPHGVTADYDTLRDAEPVDDPEALVDPWWVWALTVLAGIWLAAQAAWTGTTAIEQAPGPEGAPWQVQWGAAMVLVLQVVLSAWLLVHLVRTAVHDRLRGRDGVLTVVACVVSAAMALVTWSILR